MIGIDTNILVRFLTKDDAEQSFAVATLFKQHDANESTIFINNIVLSEVVWVLEKGYKYSKQQVIYAIKLILQTPEFAFSNHNLIVQSLYEYEQASGADFTDILISYTNHHNGCSTTYSFDKKACKTKYFQEL